MPARLHDQLALGRRNLMRTFAEKAPRLLKAGEVIGMPGAHDHGLCYLRAGWACQFRDLRNGGRVIVDVYVPGDVVGLDTASRARPLEDILTLTSSTVEAIPVGRFMGLLLDPPTALYCMYLMGQQRQRADRLYAAVAGLDARGRLATLILEFYHRLRRRRLITGLSYNLPLTQLQIGRHLGLTVVHINRVLQALRADRLADLQKHSVTIFDLERLTSLASQRGAMKLTVPDASSETPVAVSEGSANFAAQEHDVRQLDALLRAPAPSRSPAA